MASSSQVQVEKLASLRARMQSCGARIIDAAELDWKKKELLGQGTNGKVYHAVWRRSDGVDIEVAAKQTNSFDQNETEVLMQLKHKYIIGYYGVVIEEPTFMIIMEYAPNGSLGKFLEEKRNKDPLPMDRVLSWCVNLAEAVQYLHDNKDLVHRDIKAPNCLISSDLELKLCDFHDARELVTTVSTDERGSRPWMAPEVMCARKFSKKSDIYSLAVVFWQILTSKVPFAKAQNSAQIVWSVCSKDERPEIPKSCPEGFAALLTDCWLKERSDRPDISQVLARLQSMISHD